MESKEQYPLFTVIIPQKNRAEYLIHTLKTCMIQDYPNFEVIVGDDCSDDNSVEIVKECMKKDSRIKLIAHEHHVGMHDNFEIALSAVRPGYVMALGGDDGLVPGCIWRMYEILKQTGKQLLTWTSAIYAYPEKEGGLSRFIVRRFKDNDVKIVKSSDYLNKIARTLNYHVDDCPMFYIKGVASTELVDRVKKRTPDGCFYYCPTPDGFSGVVLAGEVEYYAYTNEPLSIGGNTIKSQGANYKRTDENSKREAQQFFEDSSRRTMHHELASQPYSPLIVLMTADYLLTARDLPGWPGKFNMFKFEDLIKACFKMLEKNPFENEVLVRELLIIKKIAEQHGLLNLYQDLLKNTKRRLVRTTAFSGFVITKKSFMFEGSSVGINNIYDAALAVPFTHKACNRLISGKEFCATLKRMFKTVKNSKNYKIERLPFVE